MRPVFDAAFREFGLPEAMRTDNGPPFASTGAGGLTRLAVQLGQARHPARAHRARQAAAERPARADAPDAEGGDGAAAGGHAAEQQARFDAFRRDYNDERPHEALGQDTPAAHYRPSPRRCPERARRALVRRRPCRPPGAHQRRDQVGRRARLRQRSLIGETVGVAETEDGDWIVRFADIDLGLIDRTSKRLRRFLRPGRGARKPPMNKPGNLSPMFPVHGVRPFLRTD